MWIKECQVYVRYELNDVFRDRGDYPENQIDREQEVGKGECRSSRQVRNLGKITHKIDSVHACMHACIQEEEEDEKSVCQIDRSKKRIGEDEEGGKISFFRVIQPTLNLSNMMLMMIIRDSFFFFWETCNIRTHTHTLTDRCLLDCWIDNLYEWNLWKQCIILPCLLLQKLLHKDPVDLR